MKQLNIEQLNKEFDEKFAGSHGYCNPTYSKLIKSFLKEKMKEVIDEMIKGEGKWVRSDLEKGYQLKVKENKEYKLRFFK